MKCTRHLGVAGEGRMGAAWGTPAATICPVRELQGIVHSVLSAFAGVTSFFTAS